MAKLPTDAETSILDYEEFLKQSSNPDVALQSDETVVLDTESSIPDYEEFLKQSSNPDAALQTDETVALHKAEVNAQPTLAKAAKQSPSQLSSSPQPNTIIKKAQAVTSSNTEVSAQPTLVKATKQSPSQLSSSPQPNTSIKKAQAVFFTEAETAAFYEGIQQSRSDLPKIARPDNLESALTSLLPKRPVSPATLTFKNPSDLSEIRKLVGAIETFNHNYRQLFDEGITLPQLEQLLAEKPDLLAGIKLGPFLQNMLGDQSATLNASSDKKLLDLLQQPVTPAIIQAFSHIAKNTKELNHLHQQKSIKVVLNAAFAPAETRDGVINKLSIAKILEFNRDFAALVETKTELEQQSGIKKGLNFVKRENKKDNFRKAFYESLWLKLSPEELKKAVANAVNELKPLISAQATSDTPSKAPASGSTLDFYANLAQTIDSSSKAPGDRMLELYKKQLDFEDLWQKVKTQIDAMLNNKIIQPHLYDIVPRIKALLELSHKVSTAGHRGGPIKILLEKFAADFKGIELAEFTKLGQLLIQADALEADLAGIPLRAITEKQDLGIVAGLSNSTAFLQLKDKIPLLQTDSPLSDKVDVINQLNALLNGTADGLDKLAVLKKLTDLSQAFTKPLNDTELEALEQARERQLQIAEIKDHYLNGATQAILSTNPRLSVIAGKLDQLKTYLEDNPATAFNTGRFRVFLKENLHYTLTELEIATLKAGFRAAATATLQSTPYKQAANPTTLDGDALSTNLQTLQTSLSELNKQFRPSILKAPSAEFSQQLKAKFGTILKNQEIISATGTTVGLLKAVIKDDTRHNDFMGVSESKVKDFSNSVKAAKNNQTKLESNCLALLTKRADILQKNLSELNKKSDTILLKKHKHFDVEMAKELVGRFETIEAEIDSLSRTLNQVTQPENSFLQNAVVVLNNLEAKAGIKVVAGTTDSGLKQNLDILRGRIAQAEGKNMPLEEIKKHVSEETKKQTSAPTPTAPTISNTLKR